MAPLARIGRSSILAPFSRSRPARRCQALGSSASLLPVARSLTLLALGIALAAPGCKERKEETPRGGAPAREAEVPPWERFDPGEGALAGVPALDLRGMNEAVAGEGGFIQARGGHLVHSSTGRAVRFWGVNGPPAGLTGAALRDSARFLARHGVNLVRIHAPLFDERGDLDTSRVLHTIEVVEAMKAEGIYSHLSILLPPLVPAAPGLAWLEGYDGRTFPFGALFFNPDFQARYRSWWKALLLTPSPRTGRALVEEPAVAGLEMQNEDSLLFWTFGADRVPDAQMRILEGRFAGWLAARHGSAEAALQAWGGRRLARDSVKEGRVAIRSLHAISTERTRRDAETATFLAEVQAGFYRETHAFLRSVGFRGFVVASNWTTASPTYLDPLEILGYLEGDVVDHHGYFGCKLEGKDAEWSLRPGQTWFDRSALRFDGEGADTGRRYSNPVVSPRFDGRPTMISETTWTLPNRFRSEAPLYLAVYGALQDVSAIVHFAYDGDRWTPSPGPVMQPWPLMSPAMLGQFPAAAVLFRAGLVEPGSVVADVALSPAALLALGGSPVAREVDLDEARRLPDLSGAPTVPGGSVDPLVAFAGILAVRHVDGPGSSKVPDPRAWVDRGARTVTSTTGELRLDYGRGLLVIDAPAAQGASGRLGGVGVVRTRDLSISSSLDNVHLVAVSLDGRPLATAGRILVQVMSEERPSGWRSSAVGMGRGRIDQVGGAPWEIRPITGTVEILRPDAASLAIRALDGNGARSRSIGTGGRIQLEPGTIYYLVEAPAGTPPRVRNGPRRPRRGSRRTPRRCVAR